MIQTQATRTARQELTETIILAKARKDLSFAEIVDGTGLSEHAFGNAFDIAAFRFDDGSRFAVEPRADKGDLAEAFQRAVRGAACLYFTTVLGPGANAAHDNHLHLDIKARRGGWRLCQ